VTGKYDQEAVEKYLDTASGADDGRVEAKTEALLNRFVERVKAADGGLARMDEVANVTEALAQLANETGEPGDVIAYVHREGNNFAQATGQQVNTGTITGEMLDKTREFAREARGQSGVEYEVEGDGIGFDRYLEEHLIRVVKVRTTDHVSDVTTRFEFDDGASVECDEGTYLYWEPFYREVEPNTDPGLEVIGEFASQQSKAEISEDDGEVKDTKSAAFRLYCKLSLGPESRPWAHKVGLWNRAIKNLVKEYGTENVTAGPRTEAWNKLCEKVSAARATTDLHDATMHGEVYVDEAADEVWVPTKLVASVVEDIEIDRRDLATELAALGVDSDQLPGDKVVDRKYRSGTHEAFWRLDAAFTGVADTHAPSPEPREIVDSINTGGASNIGGSSCTAATDGGTYGRDPTGEGDSNEKRGNGE
jgi:hypothetical protein